MKNALTYKSHSLVFKQWSGKQYAIFSSLGKEINIGHVDIDISDKALDKSNKKRKSGIILKSELNTDKNEEPDESLIDCIELQFIAPLITVSNLDDSRQQFCCLIYNYILEYFNISPCNSGHANLFYKFWYYDN